MQYSMWYRRPHKLWQILDSREVVVAGRPLPPAGEPELQAVGRAGLLTYALFLPGPIGAADQPVDYLLLILGAYRSI